MKPLIRKLVTAAGMIANDGAVRTSCACAGKGDRTSGLLDLPRCSVASAPGGAAAMSKTIPDDYAHPGHH
jgi:hypothetical protein